MSTHNQCGLYGQLEEKWAPDQFTWKAEVRQNGNMQYHISNHGHGLKEWDWKQYLDFADLEWKKQEDR